MEFNAEGTQAFEQKCAYVTTNWHDQCRSVYREGGGFLVLRSQAIFSLEITKLILICNGINVLEGNNIPPAKTNLAAGTRSPFRVPLKKKKKNESLEHIGKGRKERGRM